MTRSFRSCTSGVNHHEVSQRTELYLQNSLGVNRAELIVLSIRVEDGRARVGNGHGSLRKNTEVK